MVGWRDRRAELVVGCMLAVLAAAILRRGLRSMAGSSVSYLGPVEAQNLDIDLFTEYQYSLEQLVELAGLAVAKAVSKSFPTRGPVLVVCGPGNNGADGLVAARHLAQFGYQPRVVYPKQPSKHPYLALLHQVRGMEVPVSTELPGDLDQYVCILDAVFGFSFKGSIRAPFDTIIPALSAASVPIASVDVPSGWNVESGPPEGGAQIRPDMLISLTAPKLCSRHFTGRHHWLGGRFVPPGIAAKYNLSLPDFPGTEQVVLLE